MIAWCPFLARARERRAAKAHASRTEGGRRGRRREGRGASDAAVDAGRDRAQRHDADEVPALVAPEVRDGRVCGRALRGSEGGWLTSVSASSTARSRAAQRRGDGERRTWSQTTTVPGSQRTRVDRVSDVMWSCRKSSSAADSDGLKPTTARAIVGLTNRALRFVTCRADPGGREDQRARWGGTGGTRRRTGWTMTSGCVVSTPSAFARSGPRRATSPTLALVWTRSSVSRTAWNAGESAS